MIEASILGKTIGAIFLAGVLCAVVIVVMVWFVVGRER